MAKLVDNLFNRIIEGKLSGIASLEVGDVKSLTSEQCESLNCGDIVVKKDEAGEHAYIVSYKKNNEMCITYADHTIVEENYFEKGVSGWAFIQTDIGHLGGTKLYNHEISFSYDGYEYNLTLVTTEDSFSFSALKDKSLDNSQIISGYIFSDLPSTAILIYADKSNANAGLTITGVGDNDGDMGLIFITIANNDLNDESLELTDTVTPL